MVFSPSHLKKIAQVNLDCFPNFRGENNKYWTTQIIRYKAHWNYIILHLQSLQIAEPTLHMGNGWVRPDKNLCLCAEKIPCARGLLLFPLGPFSSGEYLALAVGTSLPTYLRHRRKFGKIWPCSNLYSTEKIGRDRACWNFSTDIFSHVP